MRGFTKISLLAGEVFDPSVHRCLLAGLSPLSLSPGPGKLSAATSKDLIRVLTHPLLVNFLLIGVKSPRPPFPTKFVFAENCWKYSRNLKVEDKGGLQRSFELILGLANVCVFIFSIC